MKRRKPLLRVGAAAGAPAAVQTAVEAETEAEEETKFSGTRADWRRREEVDFAAVPSFSAELVDAPAEARAEASWRMTFAVGGAARRGASC